MDQSPEAAQVIQGSQWFIWEVLPVLEAARAAAPDDYKVAVLLVDGNKRYDEDSASETPTLYRQVSPYWQAVDEALARFATVPAVAKLVADLPRDPDAVASKHTALIVGLALAGLAGAGYMYLTKGGR